MWPVEDTDGLRRLTEEEREEYWKEFIDRAIDSLLEHKEENNNVRDGD